MCYDEMFSGSRNLQMVSVPLKAAGACASCHWVSQSLIDDTQNKTCLKWTRPLPSLAFIVPDYLFSVVIGSTRTSFPRNWGMGQQFNISGHFTGEQQSRAFKTVHRAKTQGSNRGAAAGGQEELPTRMLSTSQPPSCLPLWTLQFFNTAPKKNVRKERWMQGE